MTAVLVHHGTTGWMMWNFLVGTLLQGATIHLFASHRRPSTSSTGEASAAARTATAAIGKKAASTLPATPASACSASAAVS